MPGLYLQTVYDRLLPNTYLLIIHDHEDVTVLGYDIV
jgi:hypothetical protein